MERVWYVKKEALKIEYRYGVSAKDNCYGPGVKGRADATAKLGLLGRALVMLGLAARRTGSGGSRLK